MAEGHWIWKKCRWCDGTGQHTQVGGSEPPELNLVDCEYCDATGGIFWGWMSKDNLEIPDPLQEP